jgi:hypothetical protein
MEFRVQQVVSVIKLYFFAIYILKMTCPVFLGGGDLSWAFDPGCRGGTYYIPCCVMLESCNVQDADIGGMVFYRAWAETNEVLVDLPSNGGNANL